MRRNYHRRKRVAKRRFHRKKRGPTHRNMGSGRGIMGNAPRELAIIPGLGFPARMRAKLRYNETFGLVSTAGALNVYTFYTNGLYDPNYSGGGHQPMYFDQFMAVYDHYKVIGSKIQVQCVQGQGTTVADPTWVSVIQNDDATISSVSQFNQLIEWGIINKYRVVNGPYGMTTPVVFNEKWSCKRVFKDKYSADTLIGDASSNPTEFSTFMIVQQPITNGTVTNNYVVTIDYIVDFFELKDAALS